MGQRTSSWRRKKADAVGKGKRFHALGIVATRERKTKGDQFVTLAEVMQQITVVDPLFTTCGINGI